MPPARRYTILVTGVGAIIGYGVIRSLRASRFNLHIVGMDLYADAVGRHWCDAFEPTPRADSAHYPKHLAAIIQKHSVDLVIPGIEQDLHRIIQELEKPLLAELAPRFAINRPDLARLAADKWAMHQALVAAGLPVIPTALPGEFDHLAAQLGVPFLLKPRRSYAGKGIQLIETAPDLEYWTHKLAAISFILQQIVGSDDAEFTVAAFGLGDGQPVQQIALRRGLAVDGSTAKARLEAVLPLNDRKTKTANNMQFAYAA